MSKVIQHTLLYGLSIVLMKGLSLIMLPFIAHHLSTDEFAKVEILSSLTIIASVVIGLGLDNGLYRFVGFAKTTAKKLRMAGAIYTLAVIVTVFTLIISTLIAPALATWLPGNIPTEAVYFALAIVAFEGVVAIPLGWLRMYDKAGLFFCATFGRVLIQALLTVFFLLQDPSVTSIFSAGLMAVIAQALFLGYWQLQDVSLFINTRLYTVILRYTAPILGSGLCGFVLMGADRWFIANMSELEQVALYGVAAKFALGVVLLLQPYTMWWSPKRFLILEEEGGKQKVAQCITLGMVILGMSGFVVITGTEFALTLMMPEQYHDALSLLTVLVMAMMAKEAAELINIGCFISATTQTQWWINVSASALGLILLVWLTPLYGALGAGIALCLAQSLKCVLFFYYSQKQLFLSYSLTTLLGAPLFFLILGTGIQLYFTPMQQLSIGLGLVLLILGLGWVIWRNQYRPCVTSEGV